MSIAGDHLAEAEVLKVALGRAAYALFQIKRMVGVPQHVIDFVIAEHAEACKVLDGDGINDISRSSA